MTYTCSKCGHSYTQPIAKIKSDDSNKDNGSQNQKPQSGTDNGNQNQKPQPDTDNGKEKGDSIKPYIKDDSGKEGWDVIKPQLEEAKAGDTVTVAMNGTTVVPKDVIDSIKGKDTTLVLDMGNGLSWKIYGKDITDAAGDIDFDVTVGADAGKSIPVEVINNVTGERSSLNLTLAYDGEFGFTATLTVNMESKNAGLYGLVKHGVRVYEWTPGFCHAKKSVADDCMATCGTINLDYRSLYHHFENGCFMADCQVVVEIKNDLIRTMGECRDVTDQYQTGRSAYLRLGQLFMRLFAGLL